MPCLQRKTVAALCLFLSMLAGGFAQAAPAQLPVDDFEQGLAPVWEVKEFKGFTDYLVVPDSGGHVLLAESRGAASGLIRKIDLDPREWPVLSWRWKVAGTIPQGDERTKAGDDYAARVYIVFPHWFLPKTRSLNYIWANRLPKGDFLPNAYVANNVMIAVQSGPEKAGQWLTERRDIAADYRRAFGEDPPQIGAIAIMTDTDNTGASATAWYDDLLFTRP